MLGLDIYMTYYEIQDILKDLEEGNKAIERANAKFKTKEESDVLHRQL